MNTTLKTLILLLAVAVMVLPSCSSSKQATTDTTTTTATNKRQGAIGGQQRQASKINQPLESHRMGQDDLMTALALSDEQHTDFINIQEKYQKKIQKVGDDKKKVRELQQKKNKEIAKVFSPEQFETYKTHVRAKMAERANRPRGGKPSHAGHANPTAHKAEHEALMKKLNLTAEQKVKFEALRTKHRSERESMWEDSSAGDDKEVMRAKMMDMRKRHMAEVKMILTPEQYSVFEQHAKKHMGPRHHPPRGGGIRGKVQGGPR